MLEAFLYRHDFCSKGLRLELWRLRQSHTHPTGIVLCIPSFDTIFIGENQALLLLGARRDMKYRGYTPEESHIPDCFVRLFFFVVVIFGDSGWWNNSCWSQHSIYGKSGFLMLLQFVTSSMLHLISIACWIMLIHVDKLFVKHSYFCCQLCFSCVNLCGAQAKVLDVSMKYQWLMTWSYHIIAAITEVLLMCWALIPTEVCRTPTAALGWLRRCSQSLRGNTWNNQNRKARSQDTWDQKVSKNTLRCLIFWCSIEKLKRFIIIKY